MYRPENFMLNRATSNKVFGLALMPNWFSAIHLKRQYVFNKAKLLLDKSIARSASFMKYDRKYFRASNKIASERGTVPFCSADSAKLGQSPAILLDALRFRLLLAGIVCCAIALGSMPTA